MKKYVCLIILLSGLLAIIWPKKDTDNLSPYLDVTYALSSRLDRYEAYGTLYQDLSINDVVLRVNMNLDKEFYDPIIEVSKPDLIWVMCNKFYKLPSDYTPKNLETIPSSYHLNDGKTYQLVKEALDAYLLMYESASANNIPLTIVSAYRTHDYQGRLYNNYVQSHGKEAADQFSARPGHSEHETGLAIDLNQVSEAFEKTDAFKWLQSNAHKYGYVLRYPKGLEPETGYMYEPWHYRYVGVNIATYIFNNQITFDAYYAMYLIND